MSSKNRIAYFDVLESIAIFLVIICHGTVAMADSLVGHILVQFTSTVAVPIFFMVNGALILRPELDLKRHIKKTAIMFGSIVVWKIIYLIVEIYLAGGFIWSKNDLFYYFTGQRLANGVFNTEHFWFLHALISIYMLVPLLCLVLKTGEKKIYTFYIVVTAVVVFCFSECNAWFKILYNDYGKAYYNMGGLYAIFNPFGVGGKYVLFFILGAILHKKYYGNRIGIKKQLLIVAGIVGTFIVMLLEKMVQIGTLRHVWVRLDLDYQRVTTAVLAILIFILFATIEFKNTYFIKITEFVSVRTMGIYGIHMLFAEKFDIWFRDNVGVGGMVHVEKSILVFVVSLIGAEIFALIPYLNKALNLTWHIKKKQVKAN